MVKSPYGTIMTCLGSVKSFEDFDRKQKKLELDMAICDIDGSFTNKLDMPDIGHETTMIKSLWLFQEKKGA